MYTLIAFWFLSLLFWLDTESWATVVVFFFFFFLSVSLYETKRWKVIFSNPYEDLEGWGFQFIGLIWIRCQRPPSGRKVFWLGLQVDCFWSQIYDFPLISACHTSLQGVRHHPPSLSHPDVFSLTVRTMERGVHVQASAHHSLACIGSSSWLEVPESFHGCSDGWRSSGAACGIHAPSLATLCAHFSQPVFFCYCSSFLSLCYVVTLAACHGKF
jgi:hypothetical protein